MATLGEYAKEYVPKQTKNVAELPQVALDAELLDGKGVDEESKEFEYKYLDVNGTEYRVPNIVIGQIKDIKAENPNIKAVKVKRTGEGLKTRYTVIPLL